MDTLRAEPWRPSQVGLSVLLVATVPVGVACGAIRQAAMHDPIGFRDDDGGRRVGVGGLIAACVKWHPRDHWLSGFFWAEMVVLGLATVLVGACVMNR